MDFEELYESKVEAYRDGYIVGYIDGYIMGSTCIEPQEKPSKEGKTDEE